jgi:hypothetical protein
MNSSHVTLNDFFFPKGKLGREQLSVIESSQNTSAIKGKITEAKVKWSVASDIVAKEIPDILCISISDILISAFKRFGILLKYLDRDNCPPDEVFLVSLAKCTIKSEHHPSIEILINGQKVGRIGFNITISLALKGIILKIQDGKIKEVTTGTCKGKGSIKCGVVEILKRETRSIPLPGSIALGEGIPIMP